MEVVETEIGRQALAHPVLDLVADRFLKANQPRRHRGVAVAAGGEKRPVGIEDGHLVRGHSRDRRGDQVSDRLRKVGGVRRFGADHDRRGRRLRGPTEGAVVGDDDVHARCFDSVDRLYRAGDLAFERADARNLLHEGRQAEGAHLVEELVTGIGALRQTLFREQHPRRRRLSIGNENRGSFGVDVELDAGLVERGPDPRHILAVKPRIQHLKLRAAEIERRSQ